MSFRQFSYGRLYFSILVMLLAFMGVLYRHAYLAIDNQKFLLEKSQVRTRREIVISSEKGQVFDRNDQLLAVNIPYYRLAANTKKQSLSSEDISVLARILDKSRDELERKLEKKAPYVSIADRLTMDQVKSLSDLSIEGLIIEEKKGRYYTLENSASPLIGYVDIDGKGQLGVEYQFDAHMTGQDGKMSYTQNLLNQVTKVHKYQSPVAGKSLRLTIDYRLQHYAYNLLKDAVAYHGAESASAIVLSAKTGEVLAMTSYPSFNPNQKITAVDDNTKNRVVADLFEPGSVIKPIALAAVLAEGRHDPEETIDVSGGSYEYMGKVFRDHQDFDKLPFRNIFVKSSNIAMVKLVSQLPSRRLIEMYHKFGLLSPTFIQLPGESVGRHVVQPTPIDEAAMSYGYGLSVNMLSVARAYNILANNGYDPGVHVVFERHRPEPEEIIAQEIVAQIKEMMVLVTEKGISSYRAKVGKLTVAGKSGTTHLLGKDKAYEDSYASMFAGFLPSEDPELVTVVRVNKPTKNGYFGGQVAAPIFSKLSARAYHYLPEWK